MQRAEDVYVGRRIRQRRWVIGITQNELAERIGVQFQQVQKYETGRNRVSASKLWEIAKALNVSVPYFFEGLNDEDSELEAIMSDQHAMALVAMYFRIPQAKREAVLKLAQALAVTSSEG